MRPMHTYFICIAATMIASSCANARDQAAGCPMASVVYLRSIPGDEGGRDGEFLIANSGSRSLRLPVEWGSHRNIHSQYADSLERSAEGREWRVVSPVLAEVMAWDSSIVIGPGAQATVAYHANGLFDSSPKDGTEYAVEFRDADGCSYRSAPFTWSPR